MRGNKPPANGTESGQSLIILALGFLGLIAMLGLALDLSLLYVQRIHMKRAVDAASLAGVVELPDEEQSMVRAIEYLKLNNYDVGNDVAIRVMGCTRSSPAGQLSTLQNHTTPYTYIAAVLNPPRVTFTLDTYSYQTEHACDSGSHAFGTANKIAITGTVMVPMNFMQFFGFRQVPASDAAAAQNITNLDVVVTFDHTGSMQADTICYDCWHKNTSDIIAHPFPYNGTAYPISYTLVMTKNLCNLTSQPYVTTTGRYLIMEAELYSRNNSSWYRETRQTGVGYWALQRGTTGSYRSSSIDGTRSAHVGVNPYWTYGQPAPPAPLFGRFYTLQDAQNNLAPRLDYDFTPDWTGTAYIWLRAQGGGSWSFWNNPVSGSFYPDPSEIYWAVDSATPVQNSAASPCNNNYDYAGSSTCYNQWSWIQLGSVAVTTGVTRTLKLFAGSPGYEVDKIVVTSNSSGSPSQATLTYDSGRGWPATVGSARGGACDKCNPIFGLTVNPSDCTSPYYLIITHTNRLADDLFSDFEPIRTSQEATKRFVMGLEPQHDQVGFVGFDTTPSPVAQLSCLRRYGAACYDIAVRNPPISYTTVLTTIENQSANGGTDIASALRAGIEVYGVTVDSGRPINNSCSSTDFSTACGRGGAAKRIMVLLTDGAPSPNAYPTDSACAGDGSLWPYNNDPAYDCVIYYARKAHASGVTIYAIGLGNGAVPELLQAVADETGGTYYFAPSPKDLDNIFQQILANIYVRLIE